MSRRLARELALKILYCYDSGRKEIPLIMDEILDKKKYDSSVKTFTKKLAMSTLNNLESIDEQIKGVIKNWEYDRISTIDRLILRIGVCELLFFEDIPCEVTINEAIEIAKKYGNDESNKFVNGILDAIARKTKKLRKHEGSNN
ncbi:MAG: transcription antitermination factor NusB [candidate division WOR-3 bacterium]